MIAELLRYPFGTARAAERPDGRGNGLPDLARAGLIGALQPRYESGVSPDSTQAQMSPSRPHFEPPRQYASVPMGTGSDAKAP
jgi:hypothetical protein